MGGPGSGKRPDLQRQWEILRLRNKGWSMAEIARRLGVPRQSVANCYRRLGLHFKPGPQGGDGAERLPLTEEKIVGWARVYQARHGHLPTARSGAIRGAVGETWASVDEALRKGLRGLAGGSSLAQFLREKGHAANAPPMPVKNSRLTVKQILRWADLHHQRLGVWPRWSSGPVLDAPGEIWRRIDTALIQGTRGLPGGSSLLQLLKTHGRMSQRSNGWTPQEDALLGTMPDEQLAARIQRTTLAIAARRRILGIARFRASRHHQRA